MIPSTRSMMKAARRNGCLVDMEFAKSLDDFGLEEAPSPEEQNRRQAEIQDRFGYLKDYINNKAPWYIKDDFNWGSYPSGGTYEAKMKWFDDVDDMIRKKKLDAWIAYYKNHGGRKPPGWLGD